MLIIFCMLKQRGSIELLHYSNKTGLYGVKKDVLACDDDIQSVFFLFQNPKSVQPCLFYHMKLNKVSN